MDEPVVLRPLGDIRARAGRGHQRSGLMLQMPCDVAIWYPGPMQGRRRGDRVVCGVLRLRKCTAHGPRDEVADVALWQNAAPKIGKNKKNNKNNNNNNIKSKKNTNTSNFYMRCDAEWHLCHLGGGGVE